MDKVYCIGISGGSASGKTKLLRDLTTLFSPQEVAMISQDNYYKSIENQPVDSLGHVNYDLPQCINHQQLEADILRLKSGESITQLEYVFNNPNKEPETIVIHPAPILVVEGLFIYHFKEISNLLDLKIFVEARENIMWERRLKRDREERAIPEEMIHYQWQHHVLPAYRNFLLPYRDEADLVVMNNTHFKNTLSVIENHLKMLIHEFQ